jgi:hypothetical protein
MTAHTCRVLVTALLAGSAAADEVYLKSGGRLSGRIVSQNATAVEVDIGAGRITVPASSVIRVEEGRSALHEYQDRAARLEPTDADGWVALGDWASAAALGTQSREAYERALAASPQHPRANEALGRVQVGGRWVGEEEGYRARGYVRFEGEWITPAEHEAIVRERTAEQRTRERQEAEARVRAAEERADAAEARARQAEQQAQPTSEGLPLWIGWGAGPNVWPTGPVLAPPGTPAPIVVR